MFTLQRIEKATQEIKKSRFLAVAAPITDEQAAKEFLAAHTDTTANHNCWAWRIGQSYRFSDDGEPSGTAGKPILAVIDGQKLDRVAVVVTRWFGGILLGSGGLMRAYGGTAALCLRTAEKDDLVDRQEAIITCDFAGLALIRARLASRAVAVTGESFTETGAVLTIEMRQDVVDDVLALVTDLTRGKAVVSLAN